MTKELTIEKIRKLRPGQVIYAEYAHEGAMGCAGQMMFYILSGKKLELYVTDIYKHEKVFDAGYSFLNSLKNDEFCRIDGGFGNMVFVPAGSKLRDDEEKKCYFYEKDGEEYRIDASVLGVYLHSHEEVIELSNYPKEKQKILLLEEVPEKNALMYQSFSESELDKIAPLASDRLFLEAVFDFLDEIKYRDYPSMPHVSPEDWEDAINYIMIQNKEAFNFGAEAEAKGLRALWRYRMKYAIAKLGFYPFFNIVDNFVLYTTDGKNKSLLEILNEALGENLVKKFSKIEIVNPKVDLVHEFDFEYPQLVRYTISEDEEIIKNIIQRNYSEVKTNYYFRNYLHFKEEKALAKIVPAAFFTIATTSDAKLFYIAGDVINAAWLGIADSKEEREYQRIIYKAFWNRIGNLWPIDNYGSFEFKNKNDGVIFEDAMGWLESLTILEELNPILNNSVREYEKRECQDADKRLRKTVNDLANIKTMAKAKEVLDKVFAKNCELENSLWVLERTLLNPKPKAVGAYIVKRTAKEYTGETPIWMFTAACEGAAEKDELPELKKFAEKLLKAGERKTIIEAALEAAEQNIEIHDFQRKTMRNFKKEFAVCAKYEDELKKKLKNENSRN